MKKRLVIANWKMNPQTADEALDLFEGVKGGITKLKNVDVVIAPPFVFLPELTAHYNGVKILFGAQDVFFEEKGSYTGEVSPSMLRSVGTSFVLIGHSERRALRETNEDVQKKIKAALNEGLKVVLCIGEGVRDKNAEYLSFLKEQIVSAFEDVSEKNLKNIVVAYEPIWAIGKSAEEAMKPSQVHEIIIFIRKTLSEEYSLKAVNNMKIIYGGSVEPDNYKDLLSEAEIDGFLVGHASLEEDMFINIVKGSDSI